MSSWGLSWGDSWADSWGPISVDPGSIRGHAYGTSLVVGTLTADAATGFISGSTVGHSEALGRITFTGSGAGAGFEMGKRSLVYIKRGKKFLLFETNEQAAQFLESEKAQQRVKEASKQAPKRIKKVKQPIEINQEVLEPLAVLFGVQLNLVQLIDSGDLNKVIEIQEYLLRKKREQDDDEAILLLLAA